MRSFTTILWTTVALVALAACSGNMATPGAALPSNVSQSHTSDLSPQATEVLGRVAIRTSGGFFVTAIGGGGGPTEPNCNPGWVALHENATRIGPWETFKLVHAPITVAGPRKYAFRTNDGSYITAVNGGGIGDQSGTNPSSQLITNSTSAGAQEEFTLVPVAASDLGRVAIQTPDGKHFVTAVNGGGCDGPDSVPFHSNAKVIGPNEAFTLIKSTTRH
ncbi:MAG: hypothetical protein WBE79_01495 [Candidatus Cybelea sp.]